MPQRLLYDPQTRPGRPMQVAGFLSGSGTNIRKILDKQRELKKEEGQSPYELVVLFSDVADPEKCKIRQIAKDYNLNYTINDIWKFYKARGHTTKRDMTVRREFDKRTLEYLKEKRIDCVALGGYMSIVTEIIFDAFPTVNVHPADLSIIDEQTSKRKFTGDHAVRDAILAGQSEIRASTHLATADVDGGPIIFISKPVKIELPNSLSLEDLKQEESKSQLQDITDSHQEQLKQIGDWIIFPMSLIYIAKGLVAIDEKGNISIEDQACPHGIKL